MEEDQINDSNNNSNLGDVFVEGLLEDFDSTVDDLSSALTVSRMVSDSLIRGIVSAISDESNEKLEKFNQELQNCKTAQLNNELQDCKTAQLDLNGDELQRKKIEELFVIKKQLGDLLEFLAESEFGSHVVNSEQKGAVFKKTEEECVDLIFSDFMKLNLMKNEDLVSYLREEIMKMKREHDSLLQRKTEEVFGLKRELLREKGKNPLQCENLRKKIAKLVSNLDEILLKNELDEKNSREKESKDDLLSEKEERIRVLEQEKQEVRDLLSEKEERIRVLDQENRGVRDLLNEKIEEITVLDEENQELKGLIEKKENELEESKIFCLNLENELGQAEIREDVKKTVVKERFEEFQIKMKEELSRFNSQKMCESCLNNEEEREKLMQEVDSLSKLVQEKEKIVQEKEKILQEKEKMVQEKENFAFEIELKFLQLNKKFDSSMQNYRTLMEKINGQEIYNSNTTRDLSAICQEIEDVLVKSQEQEEEISGLKQKFVNILDDLKLGMKIDGNCIELFNEFTKNMLKKIDNIEWSLVNNVDCAVSRISVMKSQFEQLTKETKFLKNEKEWYKKSFEMSKANLRKAETEVDLLGDEVDSLMYLLNKIFRVLKHYSYVFQHYPGVTEVLKLLETYINGEGTKISWRETESIGLLTPK